MLRIKDTSPEQNLGREAADIFQEAISPDWLAKLIKGTSIVLFIFVVIAFAL